MADMHGDVLSLRAVFFSNSMLRMRHGPFWFGRWKNVFGSDYFLWRFFESASIRLRDFLSFVELKKKTIWIAKYDNVNIVFLKYIFLNTQWWVVNEVYNYKIDGSFWFCFLNTHLRSQRYIQLRNLWFVLKFICFYIKSFKNVAQFFKINQ